MKPALKKANTDTINMSCFTLPIHLPVTYQH